MPHLQHGDRTLHWQRHEPASGTSDAGPLLLVQGMAGHHRLWGEAFLAALGDAFDVVSYDHRGIGESVDAGGAEFTIADLADDAAAILDVVGWDAAHVMGISMGGMVAQELALRHPQRVNTLVLGCTYCGGLGSSLQATGPLRMMHAMETATRTGNVDVAVRVAFEANLSTGFVADPSHFGPFRDAVLSVSVPMPVVMQQAKAAFAHDTSVRLAEIVAPTLVVHGTDDQMLAYSNGPMIAELVPGATLHTMRDTGHLFWWEHPELTAQLLRRHCCR